MQMGWIPLKIPSNCLFDNTLGDVCNTNESATNVENWNWLEPQC